MEIGKHSKQEIIRELQSVDIQNLTPYKGYLLMQIEDAVSDMVIQQIRERQKRIPNLKQNDGHYLAYWGGELTPGCRDCCLKGRWNQIRTTSKCTRNCKFCYYYKKTTEIIPKNRYLLPPNFLKEKDVKTLLSIKGKRNLSGVAWLHYEPLMEIEKIPSLMKYIHENGYHQWLYTNGDLATEDNLKLLADSGLDEIRFNLAASDCSDKIIKNMHTARKLFKYLCIESPMYSNYFNSFKKKRHQILDTGVDHIHFAELQIFPESFNDFKFQGPYYRFRKGYISPISSRQFTYDIFDLAVQENWKNVVLHDCSNEVKFYRGMNSGNKNNANEIAYQVDYGNGYLDFYPDGFMGINWFIDAVRRYKHIGNDFK